MLKNYSNCQTFKCYPRSKNNIVHWSCKRIYMLHPLTLLWLQWQQVAITISIWGQLKVLWMFGFVFHFFHHPPTPPYFSASLNQWSCFDSLTIKTVHSVTCKRGNWARISGLHSSAIKRTSSSCTSALLNRLPTRKSCPWSFKTWKQRTRSRCDFLFFFKARS